MALVTRLATTLIPLALLLCACAPMATQQPSEDQAVQTGSAEPEPAPDDGSSAKPEPDEAQVSRPAAAEPRDMPDAAEAIEKSQPPEDSTPEPAKQADDQERREDESESRRDAPMPEMELELTGRVTLIGGDAHPEEAVVYFVPQSVVDAARETEAAETAEIVTRDKKMSPTVLAVSRGTEVRFPNEDPILHNLFSVSPDNSFDLGIYGPDESPSVTFEHPGVVNVYCNVHHNMHAHVLVVDTPWRARPATDGRFQLTGLPAGSGELHVWHRQTRAWSRSIDLPPSGTMDITLEVTKPMLPPHPDKAGQPDNR